MGFIKTSCLVVLCVFIALESVNCQFPIPKFLKGRLYRVNLPFGPRIRGRGPPPKVYHGPPVREVVHEHEVVYEDESYPDTEGSPSYGDFPLGKEVEVNVGQGHGQGHEGFWSEPQFFAKLTDYLAVEGLEKGKKEELMGTFLAPQAVLEELVPSKQVTFGGYRSTGQGQSQQSFVVPNEQKTKALEMQMTKAIDPYASSWESFQYKQISHQGQGQGEGKAKGGQGVIVDNEKKTGAEGSSSISTSYGVPEPHGKFTAPSEPFIPLSQFLHDPVKTVKQEVTSPTPKAPFSVTMIEYKKTKKRRRKKTKQDTGHGQASSASNLNFVSVLPGSNSTRPFNYNGTSQDYSYEDYSVEERGGNGNNGTKQFNIIMTSKTATNPVNSPTKPITGEKTGKKTVDLTLTELLDSYKKLLQFMPGAPKKNITAPVITTTISPVPVATSAPSVTGKSSGGISLGNLLAPNPNSALPSQSQFPSFIGNNFDFQPAQQVFTSSNYDTFPPPNYYYHPKPPSSSSSGGGAKHVSRVPSTLGSSIIIAAPAQADFSHLQQNEVAQFSAQVPQYVLPSGQQEKEKENEVEFKIPKILGRISTLLETGRKILYLPKGVMDVMDHALVYAEQNPYISAGMGAVADTIFGSTKTNTNGNGQPLERPLNNQRPTLLIAKP